MLSLQIIDLNTSLFLLFHSLLLSSKLDSSKLFLNLLIRNTHIYNSGNILTQALNSTFSLLFTQFLLSLPPSSQKFSLLLMPHRENFSRLLKPFVSLWNLFKPPLDLTDTSPKTLNTLEVIAQPQRSQSTTQIYNQIERTRQSMDFQQKGIGTYFQQLLELHNLSCLAYIKFNKKE